MDVSVWFALMVLFLSGGLTPGPAVMLVVTSSLRHGFRPALLPALGISTANLIWIALAALGLVALMAAVPGLLNAVKLIGIGFIIYLAWGMALAGPRDLKSKGLESRKAVSLFGQGVGLQLANPNALVFFGLMLPFYFDAERALAPQIAIIMATVTATEMFGLSLYAALADRLARRFKDPRFAKGFNRGAAALMLASGLYALWSTRAVGI
ncbi:MAG: LysE family translocator [Pseudomonadota bacterium]